MHMGGARRGTGHDVVRAKCARGMQGEWVLANPPVTRLMRGRTSPRCGVCNRPGIDLKTSKPPCYPRLLSARVSARVSTRMPHCTIDAAPAAPTILGAIKRTGTLTMQFATQTAPMRVFLGFVAGAISVLTFHQGLWALFYASGAMPMPPFPTRPMPPFSVPLIVSLCFWGGLYGAVFGLLRPRF